MSARKAGEQGPTGRGVHSGVQGICLIETMALDADGPRHLARHLARLRRSARALGLPVPGLTLESELAGARPSATADLDRSGAVGMLEMLRLQLHADGRWETSRRRVRHDPSAPVLLCLDTTPVDASDPLLQHKTTRRTVYDRARARHPRADDVVLVGSHGRVTETTIASLLVKIDGQWFTPPSADGLLPGIGRESALEKDEVRERPVTVEEMRGADALAVLSSARGRRPAVLVGV